MRRPVGAFVVGDLVKACPVGVTDVEEHELLDGRKGC